MKFAKHVAKAMTFSDPEWLPFWINYRFLKKLLPHKGVSSAPAESVATAAPKSAPARSAAVARSAPALGRYDHVRDSAAMSTGNPAGSADRRWQPRKQKDDSIQSTSPITMGAATSTTAATSTASAAAAKSRASWGVSQGPRPWPQQPWPQRRCTRLPSRRHASASSARVATQEGERRGRVVEGGGRDDGGAGRGNGQKVELAAANENRRAFVKNSGACRRPTCCSRLSSGCGAAAIPAAAAVGLCSPATSDGVLRPKHQLRHQRQQNQRLNHHPPRQAPQQQREVGGGEGERNGEGRGGHWKSAPALQCPFFSELLREIYKCRVFFLQNEDELKARTMRLQFALNQLKNPELSRLSTVKGFHVKLMKACVKFYRDALLLEDFAMVNYTAVIKLLKKRDKLTGASDQKVFMDEVMAAQPFAMYPGVAERVAQVEEIFGEIENMCFLRTGEGMKSVMKTELTVVEAILQLAQESEETQNRELLDETAAAGPLPTPGFCRRRTLLQGPSAAGAGSGKQASGGRGRNATAEAVPATAPTTATETAPATAVASLARTRATGKPSRAGVPAGEPSPSYLDGGRESTVGAGRWEVARVAPGAAAPSPPRRPSGSGKKRTASSGGGRGRSGDAYSPPSVRVSVRSRVARPLPDTGVDAPETGTLADGMVVSATGMVVSATKTPRLSTNAPRLSTTTASLGKGGGIVPKMARLG